MHKVCTNSYAKDGQDNDIAARLPELIELERILDAAGSRLTATVLTHIDVDHRSLPLYLIEMGSRDPAAPVIGLVGGIHGVERIGSQVISAYLRLLVEYLSWDEGLQEQLSRLKLFMIPIANPGGMWRNSRCNPRNVDLMRNAPIEAKSKVPFLLGGQRISSRLPWYRGGASEPMEPELQALCDCVRQQVRGRPFALTLDCHSGFGLRDRLWIPYAGSHQPIDAIYAVHSLYRLFRRSHPNHGFYKFEPQSHSYTTHGDAWDMLYDELRQHSPFTLYLPLTLEMGSWLWLRKNPRQIFRFANLFNPVVPHRRQRVLRRHLPLLEFLVSATRSYRHWLPPTDAAREQAAMEARERWFPGERHD